MINDKKTLPLRIALDSCNGELLFSNESHFLQRKNQDEYRYLRSFRVMSTVSAVCIRMNQSLPLEPTRKYWYPPSSTIQSLVVTSFEVSSKVCRSTTSTRSDAKSCNRNTSVMSPKKMSRRIKAEGRVIA